MSKQRKSTQAEYQHRIFTIAELMANGLRSNRRIILYVRQQDEKARNGDQRTFEQWGEPWDVTDDMINKYIQESAKLFTMKQRLDFDQEKGLLLERYEHVYSVSLQRGKLGVAVSALREMQYLYGFGSMNVSVAGMEKLMDTMRVSEAELAKRHEEKAKDFRRMNIGTATGGGNGNGNEK